MRGRAGGFGVFELLLVLALASLLSLMLMSFAKHASGQSVLRVTPQPSTPAQLQLLRLQAQQRQLLQQQHGE